MCIDSFIYQWKSDRMEIWKRGGEKYMEIDNKKSKQGFFAAKNRKYLSK